MTSPTLALLLTRIDQVPPDPVQPEGAGWSAVIPAIAFFVLAVIVWWIWRKLADSD